MPRTKILNYERGRRQKSQRALRKTLRRQCPPPRRSARSSDKASDTHPPGPQGFAQAGNNGTNASETWPEPKALETFLHPVLPMTPEMIPDPVRDHICDIAYRMQCPLDFPAVSFVVMTGSVIGNSCRVRPKQYDNWEVVPNLWGALIGPPGSYKSPAMKEAFRTLSRLELDAGQTSEKQSAQYEADVRKFNVTQKALERAWEAALKKTYEKPDDHNLKDKAANLERQLAELTEPQKPPHRQFSINDTTPEALQDLVADNPRGILYFNDEIVSIWDAWRIPGREAMKGLLLTAYNGNEPLKLARIRRGRKIIPDVCVSLFGGIQPDRLVQFLRDNKDNNIKDDGCIHRFQAMCFPDPINLENYKPVDQWPNTDAKNHAFELIQKIASMNYWDYGADRDDYSHFPFFKFAQDARDTYQAWDVAQRKKITDKNNNPLFARHVAKSDKLLNSLSGIFHLLELAHTNKPGKISLQNLKLGIAWTEYFETHARRTYGLIYRDDLSAAVVLAGKLKEGHLKDGFTARDVQRKAWTGLAGRDAKILITSALARLSELHWLRESVSPQPRGGWNIVSYSINATILH